MFSSNSSQVSSAVNYIEDVFSTFLYTGNGSTQTITNGIDLAGKGGLTWIKVRSTSADHQLVDTVRGATYKLVSNTTGAQSQYTTGLTSFNADGFSIGTNTQYNNSGATYVSWTFREQPKFFDVVTYTGTGSNTTIAHSLGVVPGCIIVKETGSANDWVVYHRSLGNGSYIILNSTGASAVSSTRWNDTTPTSTVFTVGTNNGVNANGASYVAYLFAHDAGGFGLTGTDNVISCGTYTGIAYPTSLEVTVGFEPQFVIIKNATTVSGWAMWDIMRGMSVVPAANTAQALLLEPNTTAAESDQPGIFPTATGFVVKNGLTSISGSGDTMIYIAIRRGPMKVPTLGTSVFSPFTTAGATGTAVTTNFPVDFQLYKYRAGIDYFFDVDRLRGVNSTTTGNSTPWLDTTATTAEVSATNVSRNWGNTGFEVPGIVGGASNVFYSFRRAPGFFDEVCYTGTGANQTLPHNLGAVPQLMITKNRSNASNWRVYDAFNGPTKRGSLNDAQAWDVQSTMWNDTAPTSTMFTVGTSNSASSQTYVIYLFATCAGVSKVGSYSGNTGVTVTVPCGFTGGVRFVLIKRTDSTGDWYVWDSARGIVAGNDPYLLLNDTAAEVTGTDYVDTYSAGFEVTTTAPAALNATGGTYIFLAIA